MGKKYLDTKKNTLEASILDVWKEAAKLNEYKTKLGEKRRVAGGDMRRTENKKLKEVEEASLFELSDEELFELSDEEFYEAMKKKSAGERKAAKKARDKYMKTPAGKKAAKKAAKRAAKVRAGKIKVDPARSRAAKKRAKLYSGDEMTTFQEEKHEYEKFFAAAMKKFNISSPADLKSDEEKKKFFDYVDKNYKSSAEKKTGKEDPTEKDKEKIGEDFQKQHEFKMQSMRDAVQRVWEMSDREKIETKRARSIPARPGKTMTGDDTSVVTVNPKIKS